MYCVFCHVLLVLPEDLKKKNVYLQMGRVGGLVAHEVLPDLVPALLRDTTSLAARLDLLEPLIHRLVPLGIARELGAVFPFRVHGLEVEALQFECVKHRGG